MEAGEIELYLAYPMLLELEEVLQDEPQQAIGQPPIALSLRYNTPKIVITFGLIGAADLSTL